MKTIPRSNKLNRGLVQMRDGGRTYLETDGRWVISHYDYPLKHEHMYKSCGTGDMPTPSWAAVGWEVYPGDRIKRFGVYGRTSTSGVNGVELCCFTLSGENGGTITKPNNYVVSEVSRFVIPTPNRDHMMRHQEDLDFEIDHVGSLIVAYRPVTKPGGRQYFFHTVECLIDRQL